MDFREDRERRDPHWIHTGGTDDGALHGEKSACPEIHHTSPMTQDIVIFDQLSDLKRLATNEAFLHLESVFQRERERFLAAMLDPKADSLATMQSKAVVNALDQLSPLQLVERSLKIEIKNRKIEHPEMFKIKRNGK
jgi:hypothetical protein